MSVPPNRAMFNQDKVANKFGIQLKPNKSNSSSPTTTTITDHSIPSKDSINEDLPREKQSNGLPVCNCSSDLLEKNFDEVNNEPINLIHSTSEQTKRSSFSSSTSPKTEAQIEYQKDQPLYRRQPSKPLDNSNKSNSR